MNLLKFSATKALFTLLSVIWFSNIWGGCYEVINFPYNTADSSFVVIASAYEQEADKIYQAYDAAIYEFEYRLARLTQDRDVTVSQIIQVYEQKDQAKQALEADILRLRYIKGIDLIRLLNEKTLSLDYHFTSLQTIEEISSLSNPTSYPSYVKFAKEMELNGSSSTGGGFFANLNGSNPYISAITSITSLLTRKKPTTVDDTEIGCILDFSISNSANLATIQNESSYLSDNFEELKTNIQSLFEDYVGLIDYHVSLQNCRKNDDWDVVYRKADAYFEQLSSAQSGSPSKAYRKISNVEFSIDKLVDFVDAYDKAVNEAKNYHKRFERILNGYQPNKACEAYLPDQYLELKAEIHESISKFQMSYSTAEIKGSKLKEILYGSLY